jgi:hypothetical protein
MKTETPVQTIRFKRIKADALFKFMLAIIASLTILFFIICGIAAFFGAHTVAINQKYITGIWGLCVPLLAAPFFAVFITAFAWPFAYFPIRIIGRFMPFKLSYVPE